MIISDKLSLQTWFRMAVNYLKEGLPIYCSEELNAQVAWKLKTDKGDSLLHNSLQTYIHTYKQEYWSSLDWHVSEFLWPTGYWWKQETLSEWLQKWQVPVCSNYTLQTETIYKILLSFTITDHLWFEVLTGDNIKNIVSWDLTSYSLTQVFPKWDLQHLRSSWGLLSRLLKNVVKVY